MNVSARFCWAYLTGMMVGDANPTQAARDAGYSDSGNSCKVRASELMHDARIMEALDELAQKELRGLALPALMALKRILDDPKHPDHTKAVLSILNRVGLSEKTQQHVTVTHQVDTEDVETLVHRLATELSIDPRKLLGRDV